MALIGAAAGVCPLALVWWVSHYVGVGKHADASILRGFADLTRPGLDQVTNFVAGLCNPDAVRVAGRASRWRWPARGGVRAWRR